MPQADIQIHEDKLYAKVKKQTRKTKNVKLK